MWRRQQFYSDELHSAWISARFSYFTFMAILDVCTRPGIAREPYPARPSGRQTSHDFFNGRARPGRQIKDDFSKRAGPGRQKRNMFFNRAGPVGKIVIIFSTAGPTTKKGRRIVLCISPGRHNKIEVFKPVQMDKRLIMYRGDNKCKCANEMCLLFSLQD